MERRNTERRDVDMEANRNLNVGALLIGCLAIAWSPMPFATPELITSGWLAHAGLSLLWTVYLSIAGSALIYGALKPHRSIRFWSLVALVFFFSAFSMLAIEHWRYNPTMAASIVLSVFCVIILIRDTRRKPRKCLE